MNTDSWAYVSVMRLNSDAMVSSAPSQLICLYLPSPRYEPSTRFMG